MTTATDLLLDNLANFQMNPSSIQQIQLNVLEMGLNGLDIVDATNPFTNLLEMSATLVAGHLAATESTSRRIYPPLALDMKDLFHHISDFELVGIYATPSKSVIRMLIPTDELLKQAVLSDNNSVYYLTISKNLKILVNNLIFSPGYPIQINILSEDSVQCLYDTTELNPLMELTTNIVAHEFLDLNSVSYLQLEIPVLQYDVNSTIHILSESAIFEKQISFDDQFCIARAYIKENDSWVEIGVTYSDKVYDINKPTLLVKVLDGEIEVSLPLIYQYLRTVNSVIRIDTYTTLGYQNRDLSQVPYTLFSANWYNYDTFNKPAALINFSKINDIIYYSIERVMGGANAATLEEVRNMIIYRTNLQKIPILLSDIKIQLNRIGYNFSILVDNITDRIYVAEKSLTTRLNNGLETTPIAANLTVTITPTQALLGDYSYSITKQDSGRYTISNEAVYKLKNGELILIPDVEIDENKSIPKYNLVQRLNNGSYFYSPFYTIISDIESNIVAKVYNLDFPRITGKTSDTMDLIFNYNIITLTNTIIKNSLGYYELILTANVPDGFTNVDAILHFDDQRTASTISLSQVSKDFNGTTATFIFHLYTPFDLNLDNELLFTNFKNSDDVDTPTFLSLKSTFRISYVVNNNDVTTETISIEFGEYMDGIYAPVSSFITQRDYQTYEEIEYLTYTEDVYEMNGISKAYTIVAGEIVFNKLHSAGDQILDEDDNPIVLHAIGDKILNSYGEEIPVDLSIPERGFNVGITVIDGRYHYVTSNDMVSFRDSFPEIISVYLKDNILPMQYNLAERTKLYYRPLGDYKTVDILTGDNTRSVVDSILSPIIYFYINPIYLQNKNILNKIVTATRSIITKYLNNTVLSSAGLDSELLTIDSKAIVGFKIVQFLPGNSIATITRGKFSVGEKMIIASDGTLTMSDMVQIQFKSAE